MEARQAVAERLEQIEHGGRDTVRVPDFADLVTAGLRSRGWFRKELMRLVTVDLMPAVPAPAGASLTSREQHVTARLTALARPAQPCHMTP